MVAPVFSVLAPSLFEFGAKLIDKIFPDKAAQITERAKAELALMESIRSGELEQTKIQLSAILSESQSADPWTSRARPTFMYVIYIMILMGIPMGFLSAFRPDIATAVATGMKAWLEAIPGDLYTLFGVGYLGYSGFRTMEKRKGVAK
jgi:hypothetical protein